jgi:DNA-binding response OmpR family regulator
MNVLPAMRQFNPDVIVLDLMLPGRSGFEVLAEVKADDKLQQVPVIIFSNKDTAEDKQKAQDLGARGFYVKAMTDLSELIELIESLVK